MLVRLRPLTKYIAAQAALGLAAAAQIAQRHVDKAVHSLTRNEK
jgi:hypothetical protein